MLFRLLTERYFLAVILNYQCSSVGSVRSVGSVCNVGSVHSVGSVRSVGSV